MLSNAPAPKNGRKIRLAPHTVTVIVAYLLATAHTYIHIYTHFLPRDEASIVLRAGQLKRRSPLATHAQQTLYARK